MSEIKKAIIQINSQLADISSAIAGAVTKPTENPVKAVSHVVQRGLQLHLWKGFVEAWNFLVEEGKIKQEYLATPAGQQTFQELLRTLNQEYIDEQKFKAQQAVFLNAARGVGDEQEQIMVIEIMKMVNKLSSAQIIMLRTIYDLIKKSEINNGAFANYSSAQEWLRLIATKSGLTHEALIENEETGLMSMRLLSQRQYGDKSGVVVDNKYRLSDFGYKIASYMAEEK